MREVAQVSWIEFFGWLVLWCIRFVCLEALKLTNLTVQQEGRSPRILINDYIM